MARAPLPKGVFKLSAASASQDFSEATKAFPFGLGRQGVHEVCEAAYGDRTAALGFVAAHLPVRGGPIIAIAQTNPLADHGRWYETGLRIFTRQSPPFLHVTARTAKQVLWATEEALSSGAPGLVIAETDTPDFTASRRLALAAAKTGVPVIADGGIKFSGDFAKAIAAGASCAMVGSMLAGTDESPGEVYLYQGRSYKSYRGMGSVGAMARGSADRYFQKQVSETHKLVPEGIEGQVPYKGAAGTVLHQLVGGLRAAMGYTGSRSVEEMRTGCRFVKITNAGLAESHVHDVQITRESPNYRMG